MAATYLSIWKGTALNTTKVPIKDGQLLFETDTKKIWLDAGTQRLQVGGQDTIAWDNITEKPYSFAPKEHNHSFIMQDTAVAWVNINVRPTLTVGSDTNSFALEKYSNENNLQWHNYLDGAYDGTYTILDNNNYTNYTITKTGDGASGTWGIDISGNALALQGLYSSSTVPLIDPDIGIIKYYYNVNNDLTGNMPAHNNANGILYLNTHGGEYGYQLGFSSDGNIYYRHKNGTAFTSDTKWNILLSEKNYSYYCLPISGGSMRGQIQFNGDFSYPGIWFRDATNSKNVGAVYMHPYTGNHQLNIRWARDDGGGDGYYYINCRPSDGAVLATKFVGPLQGAAARLALGGSIENSAMQFNWDSKSGQPTYVWGADDVSNAYVYRPANFSVAQAGFLTCEDTRATMATPANYTMGADLEFKSAEATGLSGFSAVLTVKPWNDSSGGRAHQLAFNNSGLYHRISNSDLTAWENWYKLWQAGDSVTGAVWN